MRPYERDDLPFGDSLKHLTFQTEECPDCKCVCNRRKSAPCQKSSNNFLAAGQSNRLQGHSPEPKLIKDSKLKLHHQIKDHKIVLRAARLNLKHSNSHWYKNTALRKGTLMKQSIFGSHKQLDTFKSKSGNPKLWSDECAADVTCSGAPFEEHRSHGSTVYLDKSGGHAPPCSANLCSSNDVSGETDQQVIKPCSSSCAKEARLDQQDYTVDELASYFDEFVHIPRKMSEMAEMMYTWKAATMPSKQSVLY